MIFITPKSGLRRQPCALSPSMTLCKKDKSNKEKHRASHIKLALVLHCMELGHKRLKYIWVGVGTQHSGIHERLFLVWLKKKKKDKMSTVSKGIERERQIYHQAQNLEFHGPSLAYPLVRL